MQAFLDLLKIIENGRNLSVEDMGLAMDEILDTSVSEDLMVRFLIALRDKGETEDELKGLVLAMRKRMQPVELGCSDFIDTCGTGGTGKSRFNISTAASLVAAVCGAKIAKHGNRAASSQSGSADFLEALGYPLDLDMPQTKALFQKTGFCFFYAPRFHPAMAKVASARRKIATKTIFNSLGPLLNPAGAKRQVIGVYDLHRAELMAKVLASSPDADALILHGEDGMDEVTLTGKTICFYVHHQKIESFPLDPTTLGLNLCSASDLSGETALQNAHRFLRMCDGEASPLKDCLILNAALILSFYRRESLQLFHLDQVRLAMSSQTHPSVRDLIGAWS